MALVVSFCIFCKRKVQNLNKSFHEDCKKSVEDYRSRRRNKKGCWNIRDDTCMCILCRSLFCNFTEFDEYHRKRRLDPTIHQIFPFRRRRTRVTVIFNNRLDVINCSLCNLRVARYEGF